MGLADRQYMRDPYHAPHLTIKLIIVLVALFLLQSILLFYWKIDLVDTFGLTLGGIAHGKIWQLLTFQFLHEPIIPFHILFNCIGLYFFGRPVEEILGTKKFALLYLLAGICGGILQVLITLILPHHPDGAVVGASAGICGMVAIYCSLHPMQEITSWALFFPITIRARYILIGLLILSVFGTILPFDEVAHAAHLGGILLGLAYVRWGTAWEGVFNWRPFTFKQRQRKAQPARKPKFNAFSDKMPGETSEEEFISREVDPILDKISQHGIQSLTEQERKILEAARNKMAKR
jgi:membrane associated rhomboid family serine protease